MSRTNIVLEDKLVKDALRLTGLRTKKAAVVNYARAEMVKRKKRKQLLKKEGKVKLNFFEQNFI